MKIGGGESQPVTRDEENATEGHYVESCEWSWGTSDGRQRRIKGEAMSK